MWCGIDCKTSRTTAKIEVLVIGRLGLRGTSCADVQNDICLSPQPVQSTKVQLHSVNVYTGVDKHTLETWDAYIVVKFFSIVRDRALFCSARNGYHRIAENLAMSNNHNAHSTLAKAQRL